MTTLVDLAALILTLFVMLLATSPQGAAAPRAVAIPAGLEGLDASASDAARALATILRHRLEENVGDGMVRVTASGGSITLSLAGALSTPLLLGEVEHASATALIHLLRSLDSSVADLTVSLAGTDPRLIRSDLDRAGSIAGLLRQAGVHAAIRTEVRLQPSGSGRLELRLRLDAS